MQQFSSNSTLTVNNLCFEWGWKIVYSINRNKNCTKCSCAYTQIVYKQFLERAAQSVWKMWTEKILPCIREVSADSIQSARAPNIPYFIYFPWFRWSNCFRWMIKYSLLGKFQRRRIFLFYVSPSNFRFASMFPQCSNIKFYGFTFEEEWKLKCENWFDKLEDITCATEQVASISTQSISVLIGMKFYWQKWSAKCSPWFTISSFLTFLFSFFSFIVNVFVFLFLRFQNNEKYKPKLTQSC